MTHCLHGSFPQRLLEDESTDFEIPPEQIYMQQQIDQKRKEVEDHIEQLVELLRQLDDRDSAVQAREAAADAREATLSDHHDRTHKVRERPRVVLSPTPPRALPCVT